MKVLFLTPWYPSQKDAMSGLFVQKHVEAVRAQGVEVRVIFSQSWRDTWHQWRALQQEGWMPDVVQLNIIQKQGLLALWLKKRYDIPYVIIEHWSGYLPENGQYMQMSRFKRMFFQRIAAKASMILTVSDRHAQAMQDCGMYNAHWGRIHNVVDDFFYEERRDHEIARSRNHEKRTLLHVSCFDEKAKNVKGLLRAAKSLSEKRQDWKLVLVGTGADYEEVRAYAKSIDIPEKMLEWTGELSPQEVAKQMHKADALVLSSRYETYGVILAEAVAAGLPILSTPVGIAEEIEAQIVPQETAQSQPERFAELMEAILFSDKSDKSGKSEPFTAKAVGKQLKAIYEQVCTR